MPGQMLVKYEKVDASTVHKIFTSHVLGGKPVHENILDHAGQTEELPRYEFLHCSGGRCGEGEGKISSLLRRKLEEQGLSATGGKIVEHLQMQEWGVGESALR